MPSRKNLLWSIPTLLVTLATYGEFSDPWSQAKVLLTIVFLLLLVVGYFSYMIFFTKSIQIRIHFLHLILCLMGVVLIINLAFTQDQYYSLLGPIASRVDNSILWILGLLSIGILSQLPVYVGRSLYRGLEIGVTIGAAYAIVLQVISFGAEQLTRFWQVLGFETFPSLLTTGNLSSSLIIHAIVLVGISAQAILELIHPKRSPKKLIYLGLSFIMNIILLGIYVGSPSAVFGYLMSILGVIMVVAIMAQKGILLKENRITKVALLAYVFIAITVVGAIFSPTIPVLRQQILFVRDYGGPVVYRAIESNPLIGTGVGGVSISWNRWYPQEYNFNAAWDQQRFGLANEYLDVAVQTGLPGLLSVIILGVGVLYFGYVSIIRGRLSFSPYYYASFIGLILIGTVLLVSSINIMLWLLAILYLSIFIKEHFIAKIFTVHKNTFQLKDIPPTVISILSFFGIFLYISVILYSYNYGQSIYSDILFQRAVRASERDEKASLASRALLTYEANLPASQLYVQLRLQILEEEMRQTDLSEQEKAARIERDVEEIVSVVNMQLTYHPADFAAYELAASMFSRLQGQIQVASEIYEEIFTKLQELAPNDPRVDVFRANLLVAQYQILTSNESADVTSEGDPQDLLEEAKKSLEIALEKKPNHVPAFIEYERIHTLEGREDLGIEVLEEYITFVTANRLQVDTDLAILLAQNYIREERYNEADQILDSLITQFPNSPVIYFLKGQIAEQREQIGQALEWYKKGLENEPSNETLQEKVNQLESSR